MKNKISIIMVCLNSEKTIEESINSFLTQNFTKKELIIIDGGSTDNTINIIRKFKESEPSIEMSAPRKLSFDADEDFSSDALNYEASAPPSSYHERTRRRASYKVDNDPEYFDQYFDAVREFDKDFSKVIKQDLTAIQLKSWLILFIDRLKLKNLTIEEAEEIDEKYIELKL